MSVEKTLESWMPSIDWATYYPIYEIVKEFVPLLLAFILLVYGVVLTYRAFWTSTYDDTLTTSLNGFEKLDDDAKLLLAFRTLEDIHLEDVLPKNKHLLKAIKKAGSGCTYDNPFVYAGNRNGRIQEIFLNACSGHWLGVVGAEGILAHACGLPTIEITLWFGVTFEPYEGPPIRKFRQMVITEEEMERRVFNEDGYVFEKYSHKDRIHTLDVMQKLYKNSKLRRRYLIKRTVRLRV